MSRLTLVLVAAFYFLVRKTDDTAWVRYLTAMKESIHVYVTKSDELHADHVLNLWGRTFLRMHYKMTPLD